MPAFRICSGAMPAIDFPLKMICPEEVLETLKWCAARWIFRHHFGPTRQTISPCSTRRLTRAESPRRGRSWPPHYQAVALAFVCSPGKLREQVGYSEWRPAHPRNLLAVIKNNDVLAEFHHQRMLCSTSKKVLPFIFRSSTSSIILSIITGSHHQPVRQAGSLPGRT